VLLSYIMSQSDHRLCAVEDWVNQQGQTLARATGWSFGAKDASDDHLASLVEVLGGTVESREQIEQQLGHQVLSNDNVGQPCLPQIALAQGVAARVYRVLNALAQGVEQLTMITLTLLV
jgi:hypothetical protein